MNQRSESITRATLAIAALVLISKAIGFVREMVIAYEFGTGAAYDVYLIAVSIPVAVYALVGYALSNLFVPRYSQAAIAPDRPTALQSLWGDFNLLAAGAVAVMVAIIVAAPQLLRLIAPGLDVRYVNDATLITRVSSVIILMAVAEAFFRSALNAEKQFVIPAAGPIVANVVMIGSIALFSGRLSTRAILFGVVAGYLAQALVNFVPFRRLEIARFFHLRISARQRRTFVAVAAAILMIEGSYQVHTIVDRYFASSMDAGIVSALGYASLLFLLPITIFAYALSTAIFPFLSDAFVGGDPKRSGYLLSRGVAVSVLVAIPTTVIMWLFADQIVTLFFQRGAFGRQSVINTAVLVRYLALGLIGQFLLWLLSRAYYAAGKLAILGIQVAVMLIVKVAAAVLLVGPLGSIGLAASSSISYSCGALLLLATAGRYLAPIDGRGLMRYVAKVVLASAAGGGAMYWWSRRVFVPADTTLALLSAVVSGVAVMVGVSAAVAYLLRVSDVREVVRLIGGRRSG